MFNKMNSIPLVLLAICLLFFSGYLRAEVEDDLVKGLIYSSQDIKDIFYEDEDLSILMLRHIQAYASFDLDDIISGYMPRSTIALNPVSSDDPFAISAGVIEIEGLNEIDQFFNYVFEFNSAFQLQPNEIFTVTITGVYKIDNLFFQMWSDSAGCYGTDTFQVARNVIIHQTAFTVCP